MTAESFAVAFLFGMAAGFVAPLGGFSIGAASLLLLLSTLGLRGKAVGRGPVQARGWVAGLTLALPIVALAPAMSYSLALRLELQGAVLAVTSATSLALAVLAAATITFRAPVPMRALRIAGFLAAIPASLALLAIRGTVPATLAVVGLAASLSVAAIATLRAHSARGEALSAALPVAIGLTPILLLALRMPPVAYSLVLVAFPEPLEYAWYAPQILVASGAAACAALLALRWTRGKDYRPVLDTVREGPG